jgi:hypothetical protein
LIANSNSGSKPLVCNCTVTWEIAKTPAFASDDTLLADVTKPLITAQRNRRFWKSKWSGWNLFIQAIVKRKSPFPNPLQLAEKSDQRGQIGDHGRKRNETQDQLSMLERSVKDTKQQFGLDLL